MVHNGKLLGQPKGPGILCLFKIGGEFFIKTGKVEIDLLMNRIDLHPGKIFQSLDIHVLKVTDPGKLGPKWDVQRQGNFQGPFDILMGQNAHSRGLAIG
jgi:hypothetical protein